MLYKSYYEKTRRLAGKLTKVYKKRVPILIVLAILAMAATALVMAKGLVLSDTACPGEVVYGDTLSYSAKAFLSDVSYEYRASDGSEWSTEVPSHVGEYRVRAVAPTSFGGVRYGDEHTYTIIPRPLTVTIKDDEIPWGDHPGVTADLLYDHVIEGGVIYEDLSEEDAPNVMADAATVVIRDGEGNDMTANYAVTETPYKTVSIIPRDIQITVEDHTGTYDGKELTFGGYALTGGSMADGDEEPVAVLCDDVIINAGVLSNTPEYRVYTKDHVDVTRHYNIEVVAGTLTMEKRPIALTTNSKETVYNGQLLSDHGYTITDGSLADGHSVKVLDGNSITYKGEAENKLSLQFLDAAGADQTANYSLYLTLGTLTVKPRPATVSSKGDTYVYDSLPHSIKEATLGEGELAAGDVLVIDTAACPEVVDVASGTVENAIPFRIMRGEEEVTDSYDLAYNWGTLQVTPYPITVKTDSADRTYDGTPLTTSVNIYAGHISDDMVGAPAPYVMPAGHEETISRKAAPIDAVTELENSCILTVMRGAEDVTGNYDIHTDFGTLTITPRPITVRTPIERRVYDGKVYQSAMADIDILDGHTDPEEPSPLPAYVLPDGHASSIQNRTAVQNATDGAVTNDCTLTISRAGVDISDSNYDIAYVRGTLTVDKRAIHIRIENQQKIYDGQPLTSNAATVTELGDTLPLAENHTFSLRATGSRLNANTPEAPTTVNAYMEGSLSILDADGKSVIDNYDVTDIASGTLTVNKRPVTAKSKDMTWIYDGTAHHYKELDFFYRGEATRARSGDEQPGLVGDHTYEANITGSCQEVSPLTRSRTTGEYVGVDNTFDALKIYDGTEDVTSNYDILEDFGKLTVLPRPITVTTHDGAWMYDGTCHTDYQNFEVTWWAERFDGVDIPADDPMMAGDSIRIPASAYTTFVNVLRGAGNSVESYSNDASYEVTSNAGNYIVNFVPGTVTITPRPITVTAHSGIYLYDGTAKSLSDPADSVNTTVAWTDDTMVGDWRVTGHTYLAALRGSYTEVLPREGDLYGAYTNYLDGITLLDAASADVTSNYEITPKNGSITILPRPITVTSATATHVYDGRVFTAPGYTVAWQADFDWSSGQYAEILNPPNLSENGIAAGESYHVNVIGEATYVKTRGDGAYDTYPNSIHRADSQIAGIPMDDNGNYLVNWTEGTLEITRRPITVTTETDAWMYDDIPTPALGFRVEDSGDITVTHTFTAVDYKSFRYVTENADGNNRHSLRIGNTLDNGADVTANFDIAWVYGTVTIEQRPIYVDILDVYKIYDGKALTSTEFVRSVDACDIVASHSMTIVTENERELVDVGECYNYYRRATVLDANGKDVTENYDIHNEEYGLLRIAPRPVTFFTNSRTWIYDGTEHERTVDGDVLNDYWTNDPSYAEGWVFLAPASDDPALVLDHTLSAVFEGNYVNVAQDGLMNEWGYYYENYLILGEGDGTSRIRTADGTDVTANYELSVTPGSLTILPRPIHFTSVSKTWIYDGNHHEYPELLDPTWWAELLSSEPWSMADPVDTSAPVLVGNHTYKPEFGERRYMDVLYYDPYDGGGRADGYANEFDYVIILDGETDVSYNYTFSSEFGTLTVLPRPITITSASAEKVYDGTPLTKWEATIAWSALPTGAQWTGLTLPAGDPLLSGHEPTIDYFGTRTYVHEDGTNSFGAGITGAGGYGYNYRITLEYGELTVTPRPITLTTGSAEYVYNGALQSCTAFGGELLDGHTVEADRVKGFRNVGEYANDGNTAAIFHNGITVTSSFDISYEYGTVKITPRPITVWIEPYTNVYEGFEQAFNGTGFQSGEFEGLINGHSIYLETTGRLTMPGEVANDYVDDTLRMYDEMGEDVTDNYELVGEIAGSTLTVTRRPFLVQTASAEMDYNGTALTAPGHTRIEDRDGYYPLVDGHAYALTTTGSQTELGSSKNTYDPKSFRVYDADLNDVTEGYTLTVEEGTLTVNLGVTVEIHTESLTKNPPTDAFSYPFYSVDYVRGVLPDGFELKVEGFVEHPGTPGIDPIENLPSKVYVLAPDGQCYDVEWSIATVGVLVVNPEEPEEETVVGEIYTTNGGKIYLRVDSYGDYNGSIRWNPAAEYGNTLYADYSYNYLTTHYLTNEERATMSFRNMLMGMLPYYPTVGSAVAAGSDVTYRELLLNGSQTNYQVVNPANLNWIAEFRRLPAIEQQLLLGTYLSQEYTYRTEHVYPQYLTVREDTRAFMQGIIDREGFQADDPNILYLVAEYIQNAATYTLDYNQELDEMLDVAVAFLSQYREGKCVHYATAATLLFRTLGLPARYVEGFLLKDVNANTWTEVINGGEHNAAHAWVEVYIDNLGWVMVEVTGGNPNESMRQDLPLKPADATKTYDGIPLTNGNQLDMSGMLGMLVSQGYRYEVSVMGSQTLVGSSQSSIVPGSFKIYDRNDNDVTDQFNPICEPGHLSVTRAELILQPAPYQGTYDGLAFPRPSQPIALLERGLLAELIDRNFTYEVTFIGSRTEVGVTEIFIEESTFVIYDADGNDVTRQFNIEFLSGELEVLGLDLVLQPSYLSDKYTGLPLKHTYEPDENGVLHVLEEDGLLGDLLKKGYRYEVLIASDVLAINVGDRVESYVVLGSFVLYDEKGNNVTERYNLIYETNEIVIMMGYIQIYMAQISKEYDGTPLACEDDRFHVMGVLSQVDLGDGMIEYHLANDIILTADFHFPSYTNAITVYLSNMNSDKETYVTYTITRNGIDIRDQIDIEFSDIDHCLDPDNFKLKNYVVYEIRKKHLTLTAASGVLPYHEYVPGMTFTKDEWTATGLLEGHRVNQIVVQGGCFTPGSREDNIIIPESLIIVDAEGEVVTGNYDFMDYVVKGTLEIEPPPME